MFFLHDYDFLWSYFVLFLKALGGQKHTTQKVDTFWVWFRCTGKSHQSGSHQSTSDSLVPDNQLRSSDACTLFEFQYEKSSQKTCPQVHKDRSSYVSSVEWLESIETRCRQNRLWSDYECTGGSQPLLATYILDTSHFGHGMGRCTVYLLTWIQHRLWSACLPELSMPNYNHEAYWRLWSYCLAPKL